MGERKHVKVIGISDNHSSQKFMLYENYVRRGLPDATIVRLSGNDESNAVKRCDALVLTGGGDVHPKFYDHPDALGLVEDVNEARDMFELSLIASAVDRRITILGICRGLQIFNVAMGGSLLPDIESSGYPIHKEGKPLERRHTVLPVDGTLFSRILNGTAGEVNTLHHQAVDRLGDGLRVSSKSPDGIVESIEWADGEKTSFLLLVQWHPERMSDTNSPCVAGVLQSFAEAVQKQIKQSSTTSTA